MDWDLLQLALVPPGAAAPVNNDRLEFLGDEVLRLLAARFVYERYPDLAVGGLTSVRSELVRNQTLYQWAKDLHLVTCLPKATATQLANALEAVIGALYLSTVDPQDPNSGHPGLITPWLWPLFETLAAQVMADPTRYNYKAALQEWSQRYLKELPDYRLIHQVSDPPSFTYEVWLAQHCRGQGVGSAKKRAQQEAARHAYLALPSSLLSLDPSLSSDQEHDLQSYQGIGNEPI